MKKRLFLGILALAAVAVSCSKDVVVNEIPQEQAIEFGTYLGRDAQTKGTVTNSTNLNSVGFGVYSYYTTTNKTLDFYFGNSGTATSEATQFKPNFMDNQKVYWSSSTWDYTPKKYWPVGNTTYKLSFFAYAPYDSDSTPDDITSMRHSYSSSSANEYGQPLLTYTIPETVANHQDILFAPISQNIEITKDSNPSTTEEGTVKFHFFHALSRIGFKVKSAEAYNGATLKVNSITLSGNIQNSGTMNLYAAEANVASQSSNPPVAASNNPGWSLTTATAVDYTISPNLQISESASNDISSDYIMIFPQTLTANTLTISVNYDVEYTIPATVTINNINSVQVNQEITFAPGKAYTFNLSIGLDAINFTADVEDWDTTHPNKDININI